MSRRTIVGAVAIVILIAAAFPAVHYYRFFATHVSTDDAYVDGTVVTIAPRVNGTVSELYVQENWIVKAGDPLLKLDPRDYQVRVEQAQAQLERARETVDQLYAQASAADAGVRLAQSQLEQAHKDYQRAKKLRGTGVASQEAYDQASTALEIAEANLALAQQEVQRSRAALGGDTSDRSRYQQAIVEAAKANLEGAVLNVGYTEIKAPVGGVVTHKSVHVGHRVQVGEPLMTIVPTNSLYVTANYKETQLTDVRVGQPATLEADIYPGYVFHGRVDSISFGTGSAFALLPPENATGNWVKVVQRVPVKIILDRPPPADKQLRVGLSVEVSIDISRPAGPLLSSLLQRRHQELKDHAPPRSVGP